jgi:hypothetical protein
MKGWLSVLCLVAFGACDDGDGGTGPDGSCDLSVMLSGAVTASFTAAEIDRCAAANDLGGAPIIVFYPTDETVMRLDLAFPEESAGMTGTAIEGEFGVVFANGSAWEGDCAFDIARWDGAGGQQRLQGSATCEPLGPDAGSQMIMVSGLAFDMF